MTITDRITAKAVPNCPYCNQNDMVIKTGHTWNGFQRYGCKRDKKMFIIKNQTENQTENNKEDI